MNKTFLLLAATFALAVVARADSSVKLTGVHLCCKGCVTGAEKAVSKVNGATVACDPDAKTLTISAPNATATQRAVDSLVDAGYFGKSEDATIKVKDISGAKDGKVASLDVEDVHLCCKKCVTAVGKALGTVKGVTGNSAEKGATTFEVQGDNFNPKEVFAALQKEGLSGRAGK